MKQGVKIFLLTVILVAVVIGAYFAYQNLSGNTAEITKAPVSETTTLPQETLTATDFKAVDANGNDVKLSECFGKVCVVNFWATWCGYCVQEMPEFEKVYQSYGESVHFLMVNMTDGNRETVQSASKFIAKNRFTFPVWYDTYGEALKAYDSYTIPMTVFIAADGTIFEKHLGPLTQAQLSEKLDQLIAIQ